MILDLRNSKKRLKSLRGDYLPDKKQLICVEGTRCDYVHENKRLNKTGTGTIFPIFNNARKIIMSENKSEIWCPGFRGFSNGALT